MIAIEGRVYGCTRKDRARPVKGSAGVCPHALCQTGRTGRYALHELIRAYSLSGFRMSRNIPSEMILRPRYPESRFFAVPVFLT